LLDSLLQEIAKIDLDMQALFFFSSWKRMVRGILLLSMFCSSQAVLKFNNYFGSGMVLQHEVRNKIWGYGTIIEEKVIADCDYDGQKSSKKFSPYQVEENVWEVLLDPQKANTVCRIEVTDSHLFLDDVIFGDIWLCSGQSNMQMNMDNIENAKEEIDYSAMYGDRIRYISLLHHWLVQSNDSADPHIHITWTTADDSMLRLMSAVCFLFAREISDKAGVPLGMIHSSFGGTPIEAWSSPDALDRCDVPKPLLDGSEQIQNRESYLFNGMINPLKRVSLKGFLWYQGEQNAGGINRDLYGCMFPALIEDWRTEFATHSETPQTAPFGFVQLSTHMRINDTSNGFPVIRWHQTQGVGYVPHDGMPNVFMATSMDTFDIGEGYPGGIHPRYKQVVAKRLAIAGLNVAYGRKNYPTGGPFPVDLKEEGSVVTLVYDQDLQILDAEISGFYFCPESPDKCDEGSTLVLWTEIPKSSVQQLHQPRTIVVDLTSFECVINGTLGYLWRSSPVSALYTLPIYGRDEHHLPSPPWKRSIEN